VSVTRTKVTAVLGEQLTHVSGDLAGDLAPKMDHDGFVLMAWIMNLSHRNRALSRLHITTENLVTWPFR
jgi:hypothetical protein